ncbi:FAD-dependent oxidoreductase [Streptomyces sp. NPDC058623]|uniref:FAD-dependent oxidoreductase n=1 Tax=Streptomyces sp. NPDC058623 TaxID=3346563 RepID=UPI00365207A6
MPSADNSFGFVFCGGGPAGLGPIVTAARNGRLGELLDRGIALVEPGPLGPGGLAHYRIGANSLGGPFLECLDGLGDDSPFAALRDLPETALLRGHADEHPPLSVVAPFLTRLGAVVRALLEAHPRCAYVADRVDAIALTDDDGVVVTVGEGRQLRARRAVIATGGRPLAGFDRAEIVPGLSLAPHQDRVFHSESFIDARRRLPAAHGRAVVVGGSHSAWSVVDLLASDAAEVTLIHRSELRLFYSGAEEARADGYAFDPVLDVCPANGRVNRYGGLRGRAHELAAAALGLRGPGPAPVRLVRAGAPGATDAARQALAEADVIVMANGFEANLPRLSHPDGAVLTAATGPTGTEVTDQGHLVDVHGVPHPRLIAYGLGAGLAPSAEVGGEPSYTRRADGVWLYQHDIGEIVLADLLHHVTTTGEIHA